MRFATVLFLSCLAGCQSSAPAATTDPSNETPDAQTDTVSDAGASDAAAILPDAKPPVEAGNPETSIPAGQHFNVTIGSVDFKLEAFGALFGEEYPDYCMSQTRIDGKVGKSPDEATLFLSSEMTEPKAGTYSGEYGCKLFATDLRNGGGEMYNTSVYGGSCTVTITKYGLPGDDIEGTISGTIGDMSKTKHKVTGTFRVKRQPDDTCRYSPLPK